MVAGDVNVFYSISEQQTSCSTLTLFIVKRCSCPEREPRTGVTAPRTTGSLSQ